LGQLTQSEFRQLSEDLGAALAYKALIPAEPLDITGGTTTFGARLGFRF